MRRITAIILVGMLLIGTLTVYAESPFSDLKTSNWAYESVNAMKEKGIIEGFPDGSFKPTKEVTYGEFIKMLVSSMGYANLAAPVVTSDTPPIQGHWAYNYYKKAVELKLFMESEIDSDKYQMNREIPREMMAYMIANALGDIDIEAKYATYKEKIKDVPEASEFMYPIVKVYSTGILNGYPDGTFRQKESLTRAETAVSLGRYIQFSNGEEIAEVKQQEAEDTAKLQDAIVEDFLQQTVDHLQTSNKITYYQAYGVDSAQELKEVYPIVYYSLLQPDDDLLFSTKVTNIAELRSPFNDVDQKTYAYKNMEDIGISKIEKAKDKYNSEYLVVTPKYEKTDQMEAVLIKGDKIVCALTASKLSPGYILNYGTPDAYEYTGETVIHYCLPTEEYYGGNYKNNTLMDFDYIGFYEYTGVPTVFLVKNPL